ncbi:MAG TPA: metallophosphoesterase [Candidatus Sulfotelmatobacter sp.]|jgi:predicted MPP superfamily phosphohydrolase|nr:metallophosphoesterase [Candidatus Sulfotelmatobacter sp.]
MGNSLTFPVQGNPGAGEKLSRWLGRWRRGGIEHYSDAATLKPSSAWASSERFSVNEERIWLDPLPSQFHGLRIVQISDIHHGLFLPKEWLSEAVRQANRLNPDIIALTGDFVTYSRRMIGPAAELLGRLRARYGVYAVLGNHDFRVDADAVTQALRNQRIDVLRNRHISLRFGSKSIYLIGVDDYGYGADLRRAIRGVPRDAATVLLAHNPRVIHLASRHNVSLVLSGHTHGGQVNLPLLGTVYGRSPERLRYKIGWDRMGATQIYVSRGIGTIVLPWRLRCPAEITHLELLQGATSAASPAAAD